MMNSRQRRRAAADRHNRAYLEQRARRLGYYAFSEAYHEGRAYSDLKYPTRRRRELLLMCLLVVVIVWAFR